MVAGNSARTHTIELRMQVLMHVCYIAPTAWQSRMQSSHEHDRSMCSTGQSCGRSRGQKVIIIHSMECSIYQQSIGAAGVRI
jgi:hypothetical protein